MQFFSAKDMVCTLNVTSRDYCRKNAPIISKVTQDLQNAISKMAGDCFLLDISVEFEDNIRRLRTEGTLDEYFRANPSHESCIKKLMRACFRSMEVIHFYTCSENEVKTYCLRQDTTLIEASALVDVNIAR